jgi:uncharacterized delta-60 repeat protein
MNFEISWRLGLALPVLLVSAALTACNSKTTTSPPAQTAIALARFNASDGTPDTSLIGGSGGLVTTDVNPSQNDLGFAVALQPLDGKIIAVGNTVTTQAAIVVIRYAADGKLDPTFGSGGITVTTLPSADAGAFAVALQPDRKILVAGRVSTASGSSFLLLRYHGDIATGTPGTLDTTFNSLGYVITPIPSGTESGAQAIVMNGANILIAGHSKIDATGKFAIALAQYTSTGTLDTTFGIGMTGIVTAQVTTQAGPVDADAAALAVQPLDGKIVVAGLAGDVVNSIWDVALLRYNTNGTLDTTNFGTGGIVITDIGSSSNYANAVAIQGDGKIVVAGNAFADPFGAGTSDIAVLRYNTDGTLDTTGFGSPNGWVTTSVGAFDNGFAVAVEPVVGGKIVVTGNADAGAGDRLALLRYNTDGGLDPGFGTGGIVTRAASGPGTIASANAVVLQPTGGAIVVVGYD